MVCVIAQFQENKKLSEPLTRALKEVEKLRHELANYQKDKMSLQNAKSRYHHAGTKCLTHYAT